MPNKVNKKRKIIKSFIGYAVLLWILLAFFIPGLQPYRHYVIVTGSMAPNINIGDVVIVDTAADIDNLQVGDIISFKVDVNNSGQKRVVVHYLSSIHEDSLGNTTYKTIAHNARFEDQWTITQDDIIGKYKFHLSYVGKFLLFLKSKIGVFVLGINMIGIFFIKWVLKP